jgi:2-methylisocitrate lyase-like PEP mutase family enzyme
MSDLKTLAAQFHELHVRGRPLVLFNAWDAGSARAVAAAGAMAIATGSWSVAAANGYADGENMPFALAIDNLARIAKAVALPLTIDLESGYGEAAGAVGIAIAAAIGAGAVGCNLEDGIPGSGALRDIAVQAARLRAGRAAAGELGLPFFINARTDLFLNSAPASHDEAMVAAALERAAAYAAAGADGLFVPGLAEPALIERLVKASPLPVNIMVTDSTPTLGAMAALGVARVSHGPRPYLAMMKALETAARTALEGA